MSYYPADEYHAIPAAAAPENIARKNSPNTHRLVDLVSSPENPVVARIEPTALNIDTIARNIVQFISPPLGYASLGTYPGYK